MIFMETNSWMIGIQVQRVWDSPGLDMARTGIDNIGRS